MRIEIPDAMWYQNEDIHQIQLDSKRTENGRDAKIKTLNGKICSRRIETE